MFAELEHVVACDLRIVGGVVARLAAFIVQALGFPVGLDRQVAAGTRSSPRQMTAIAGHFFVGVRVVGLAIRIRRTPLAIATVLAGVHQLGACGFFVVVGVARRDAVLDQTHLPFKLRIQRGALEQLAFLPLKPLAPVLGTQRQQIATARLGGRTAGLQRRIFIGSSMAVSTINFDGGGNFTVDMPVAVRVL